MSRKASTEIDLTQENNNKSSKRRKNDEAESDYESELEEEQPKAKKAKGAKKATSTSTGNNNPAESSTVAPPVPTGFQVTRARLLTQKNSQPRDGDCVVLWMSRDQRVQDNYAMIYAKLMAESKGVPLKVIFNLVPRFLEATIRQYSFMIKGLQEVERELRELEIPFHLLLGDPKENIPQFLRNQNASMLVCDFSPLRVGLSWVNHVADGLNREYHGTLPMVQVDAHNIIPCWVASNKLEYGARTIRSKIQKLLPEYLQEMPKISPNPHGSLADCTPIDWEAALNSLEINRDVQEVSHNTNSLLYMYLYVFLLIF